MSWNKSLPADNEKIRNLGIVIRPNWEAIEEGDDVGVSDMLQMRSVQLDNRTGLASNNDPITNTGTHYVYSKDDGGGVQEGFMKDSSGNIIQITNDGGIGSSSMRLNFDDFTNDNGTTVYDERHFAAYWARVNTSGSILSQSGGLSCSRFADARYDFTFSTTQSSTNYAIVATGIAGTNPRIAVYTNITVNGFRVQIINQNGTFISSGADFSVAVFGGRPT